MFAKTLLFCSVFCISLLLCAAEAPDTSSWLKAPAKGWHLTLESAQKAAAANGKSIYVLFTGSDWCGFCVKLQKEVLKTGRFRSYAKKYLELVYLDFPRRKKMPSAQRSYNTRIRAQLAGGGGYPTAMILDSKGNVTGKITGYRPLKEYMNALRKPTLASAPAPRKELPRNNSASAVEAAVSAAPEGWVTNLEKALEAARKSGKKVLVLRTGSDWCPPCMKLEREALSSDRFKKFAEDNLELVFLDVPRRKKISPEQRSYNSKTARALQMGGGVPSIVIVDASGKVTAKTAGYRNLETFMSFLESRAKKN